MFREKNSKHTRVVIFGVIFGVIGGLLMFTSEVSFGSFLSGFIPFSFFGLVVAYKT